MAKIDIPEGYTPGPWEAVHHGRAAYIRILCGKEGLPDSATGYAEFSVQPYIRPGEATANARLIALAPDLAARVRELEAQVEAADTERDLAGAAEFLLDRLDEFDLVDDHEEMARDFTGLIEPAMARLRAALRALASTPDMGEA